MKKNKINYSIKQIECCYTCKRGDWVYYDGRVLCMLESKQGQNRDVDILGYCSKYIQDRDPK